MDGYVTIGTELDTKDFDRQIKLTEKKLEGLEEEYNALKKAKPFEGQNEELKKLNREIIKTKKELGSLKEQKKSLSTIDLSQIGNDLENVIKKVTRWGLALFGIRSVYSAIRGAMNTISQYNETLSNQVEYIQYALASVLKPIIETIVRLVLQLISYVNMLWNSWFGHELFESAKSFEKMKNASAGVAKNVKETKKSLAGFDEMNILQDDGSTKTGGGGGGGAFKLDIPSTDELEGVAEKIGGFFSNIVDFWEEDWKDFFLNVEGNWGTFIAGLGYTLKGFYDVFKGVFEVIWGVIEIFVGLFTGDMELVEKGWDDMCQGLKDIIKGIIEVIVGIIMTFVGFVLGILLDLLEGIYNTIIKPIIGIVWGLIETIISIIKTAISIINGIITALIEILKAPFVIAYETVVGVFNGILNIIRGVFKIIKEIFTGDWKTVMDGFKQIFKGTFDTLWTIAKAPLNLIIGGINALIKGANKIKFDVPDWVPGLGGKKFGFNIPTIPKLKAGGIINMPGRGVPVGGGMAIGGEVSREGVIPLTDKQAMAELGAEIGRNVILNLTNITKLDNRQIAREQKRINAENDFAYNR